MQSPWSSWKAGLMILIAVGGIALGAYGYHAPRLQGSLGAGFGGAAAAGTTTLAATGGGSQAQSGSAQAGAAAATSQAATATQTATAKTSSQATQTAQPAQSGKATQSSQPAQSTQSAQGSQGATSSATASASKAPGQLLSSTQYGSYAYQIYPGTPSAQAQQALSGFQVSFKSLAGGKEQVTINTAGGQSQSASFQATDKLYIIETRTGDDGFGQDTNYGDDGFILTDQGGHIVGS